MFVFSFSVSKWQPWLERVQGTLDRRDAFPLDRALQWIKLESGGNVCSVGRVGGAGDKYPGHVYEAGLAQTYFEHPGTVKFGVTSTELREDCNGATARPLTDERRLLHAKVALLDMMAHRARARTKLELHGAEVSETSVDFWCWVKLVHATPALFDFVGPAKRSVGHFPSWREFKRYVLGLSYQSRLAINETVAKRAAATPASGKDDFLTRVFRNCEHFAGGAGGFVELELAVLLALAAIVAMHFLT